MTIFLKKIIFVLSFAFLFFITNFAQAANLQVLPEKTTFDVGEEFVVDLIIDTASDSINAAETRVNFPNNILEIISIEKNNSIFSFWVEEPTISNEEGYLSFIGGTPRGVTGDALNVFKVKFKTIGVGEANIYISEAVVTASDGKGTNVLSKMIGANLLVGIESIEPKEETKLEPEPKETEEPLVVTSTIEILTEPEKKLVEPEVIPKKAEKPKLVTRKPIKVGKTPDEPELQVPLYPDQETWYNHLGEVIMLWELTPDIVQVATKVDTSPNQEPGEKEEELFTGKSFGVLQEGVWYLRAQFRNNVGWGELEYYKISIDTTPPLPFGIEIDQLVSDEPVRVVSFETQDSLSGLDKAVIRVNQADPVDISVSSTGKTSFELPALEPGKHNVSVQIFDLAGNSVEDSLEFEVLPLPSPEIKFVGELVSPKDFVFIFGQALPEVVIDVSIYNGKGDKIYLEESRSDSHGHWSLFVEERLPKGEYSLSAKIIDDRGATSYLSEPYHFSIKSTKILSIGFIEFSFVELVFVGLTIVLLVILIIMLRLYRRQKKEELYCIIKARDLQNMITMLLDDLKKVKQFDKSKKRLTAKAKEEREVFVNKMEELINKMKDYIGNK